MPDATSIDIIEGLEKLFVGIAVASGPPFSCVFRGDDEAGSAQRDADRVTTIVPMSDVRGTGPVRDKRSGGSCYRLLTVATGSQYHRNRLTRRIMLADAPLIEDMLRHCPAGLAALPTPVSVHRARIIDGPRFDLATSLNATKAMTSFVAEIEYHVAGG